MSVLTAAGAVMKAGILGGPKDTRSRPLALVHRMTMGLTQEELGLATTLGEEAYVKYHLNHTAINDATLDAILAGPNYNTLTMTPDQIALQSTNTVINQVTRATILRAVMSKRQLYERVVEMWSDHFNVHIVSDALVSLLKTIDDRDVIRANALGNFGTLLRASAHSPAMLIYLNNDTNRVGNVNENYARELMELHSMGVDGGYTQQDVVEVARCFTGWTYYSGSSGTNSYRFRYVPGSHDTGQKVVLGNVIPARAAALGQQDGEDVLNILIAHPSTAKFIAKKMLQRFWGENPSTQQIDAVAAVYTASGGDIKLMLKATLAQVIAGPAPGKLKRPFHLLVSGLRALGAVVTPPAGNSSWNMQTALLSAGHQVFGWSPPNGYPDTAEYWSGLLLPRWNFGASMMNNEYTGVTVDLVAVTGGATQAAPIADRLNLLLTANRMTATEKSSLTSYMLPNNPSTTRIREAIGLATATPTFQWY
ncbi:MAG: DUF1800 domain-containing protein [Phycisphaerales bacterium]